MKAISLLAMVIACLLASVSPLQAQTADNPESNFPVDLSRPVRGSGSLVPGPQPISPVQPFAIDEYQFIGFTAELYAGNAGVLNMSRACQAMQENSRVCTLQEIRLSVKMPDPLYATAYAWVQGPEETISTLDRPVRRLDRPVRTMELPAPSNCRGWSSGNTFDFGTAIDISHVCFGGSRAMPCDKKISVACCARG